MISWRTCVLTSLLLASTLSRGDAQPGATLTTADYREQLDGLLAATRQLNSNGGAIPPSLQHLPFLWRVHTDQQDFEISPEGLRSDVRRYETEKSAANATAIRRRIESLRREMDGFDSAPQDVSSRLT